MTPSKHRCKPGALWVGDCVEATLWALNGPSRRYVSEYLEADDPYR